MGAYVVDEILTHKILDTRYSTLLLFPSRPHFLRLGQFCAQGLFVAAVYQGSQIGQVAGGGVDLGQDRVPVGGEDVQKHLGVASGHPTGVSETPGSQLPDPVIVHPAGKGDAEMRYGNSRFKARGKKAFEGRRQRLSGPLVP